MSEDSGGLSNSDDDEPPEEIGENLPASLNGDDEELQEVISENPPASINGDDVELQEVISENPPASINGDDEEQHLVGDEEQQGQRLRTVSPTSLAGRYCCYVVNIVLTGALIGLYVAPSLSVRKDKMAVANPKHGNTTCPEDWIGFGSKCFYFSEHTSNWTSSQTSCVELGAHLTQFDSQEELNFLNRKSGHSAAWIGLHRESSKHPWMWTDNTEYNNLIPIRGDGNHAYLSDRGISSGRDYIHKRWICSKPNSYTLVD